MKRLRGWERSIALGLIVVVSVFVVIAVVAVMTG